MTFSVKLFTIVSAVLAVAVNGSPVEFAEGGLQARNERLGKVKVCTGSDLLTGCKEPWVDTNTCFGLMESAQSFSHNQSMVCVFYKGGYCNTRAIPSATPPNPTEYFNPTNDPNVEYRFGPRCLFLNYNISSDCIPLDDGEPIDDYDPVYDPLYNYSPVQYYSSGPINSYQCRAV